MSVLRAAMINLTKYVQCHPSFRYLRTRHKWTVVAVFILFLVVLMIRDSMRTRWSTFRCSDELRIDPDVMTDQAASLKAQIGLLKKKIAVLKKSDSGTEKGENNENVIIDDHDLPIIYVITPTYKRPVQKAELTRLCNTFLLVPNLHWILVEDAEAKTDLVANFLRKCGVSFTHLNEPTPTEMKLKPGEKKWKKPRGVLQRNLGLQWIRQHVKRGDGGVIYFADDDNTYSLELFVEMRYTKKVSVWPVAFVGGVMVERPRVDASTGKVIGWQVGWGKKRQFATDMAGFAVSVDLVLSHPQVLLSTDSKIGYIENDFLKQLITLQDLEPKAAMCSAVLVWHTRTEKVLLDVEAKLQNPSDKDIEV